MSRSLTRRASVLCTLVVGLWACGASARSEGEIAAPNLDGPTSISAADVPEAQAALLRYLEDARRGKYADAMARYGGHRDDLPFSWFESGDTLSNEGFLREACKGLLFCHLNVRRVLATELIPPDTIRFTLELSNPDGTHFHPAPCCGGAGPADTAFVFTVRKTPAGFVMLSFPVYRP